MGPASQVRAEFADRLRRLRVARGYKHARALARLLDLDENRYTRYERGEVEPNLATILRICAVLGTNPNELLGYRQSGADDIDAAQATDGARTRRNARID